jgi:asparagine synthetase B (glutamine-hydrolysing)/glycosyltransferase involved in cell wall biosynthesis
MWIDRDGARAPRIYADLAAMLATGDADRVTMDAHERAERLRAAMLDSVRHHLVADVDVGVFLSAGIDSSVLAALAAEAGGRLRTVTLGFAEYRGTPHDETPMAEAMAKRLGTEHSTIWVTRADFRRALEDLLERMDQPTIDGVNSYFVARAAKEAGLKVAISGLGGDELFAGYSDFTDIPRIVSLVKKVPAKDAIGRTMRKALAPLLAPFASTKYASVLEYGGDVAGAYLLRRAVFLPWEVRRILGGSSEASEHETVIMRELLGSTLRRTGPPVMVSALEGRWYMRNQLLRDADWASMTHSVEVRVPLVDWTLWREVATLGLISPYVGKQALSATPAVPLPAEVLKRRKTGFTVPMRSWMMERDGPRYDGRGLRGWAKYVYARTLDGASTGVSNGRWMTRALVFLTDAFGGRGGIAQFNRDLLTSLSSDPAYSTVVALPRLLFEESPRVPAGLDFRTESAGGKLRYVAASMRAVMRERFDVVICSHINLLPIAAAAAAAQRVPLLLVLYGIEAWKPPRGLAAKLVKRADAVVAISEYTKKRFLEWSGVESTKVHVIPCGVDATRFGVGPKRDDLLRKYQLQGRTVILTVARLAGKERAKGIDEVMESLTDIAREIPNISYLVVGDGSDRERLEERAVALGVSDRVVFAGFVSEEEKADHYRLADAFVMPGRGEGFGIVYLEALACGVPIVASSLDASAEVVLNKRFGRVVNPDRPGELTAACVEVLSELGRVVPGELSKFSLAHFRARWTWLLAEMSVGGLAMHPTLVREAAHAGGVEGGGVYGAEKATPTTARVVVER